jgi:hypothetical protein
MKFASNGGVPTEESSEVVDGRGHHHSGVMLREHSVVSVDH